MERIPSDAVLLILDVQKAFDDPFWGRRNNAACERNNQRLLEAWRATSRPVIHVKHDSVEPGSTLRPGQPGNDFKPEVQPLPGEPIIPKSVNSAFIGTKLEAYLRQQGWDTLVITGIQTDHCVSTTVRMAGNLGFRTFVVGDATATFDRRGPDGRLHRAEDIAAIHLASLHGEFATVVDTDEVLAAMR